ncbi:MAG: restriction endonuclease subunit S [Shouchella clausii]|jgi:type I restriction enzyme, S subunit|uniref:restriction endonuclease subunit S n=1 Tax=Shouchella clausii TaxID=79880 RepID=UPI000D1E7906|nr:restriction endonuclease subunit S [Shouchella clausii]PTL24937.1 restriction endonuclease [Shouchella clausii]
MAKKKKTLEELLEEALVPEEEQPYEVPGNWVWTNIKTINTTKKRSIKPNEFDNEVFELYSVPSYPQGNPELVKGEEIGSNKQIVNNGDVLLCKINPRINRVWMVNSGEEQYRKIASTEWIVIKNANVHSDYLLMYFKSPYFRKLLTSNVTGVGGSLTRARPKEVENYTIPLPPLNEQKRIADKVERFLNKIDEAKRLIDEAKESFELRRAAILDKAFRGELTREWRIRNDFLSVKELYDAVKKELKIKDLGVINIDKGVPKSWLVVKMGEVIKVNPPRQGLENISDDESCTFISMSAVSDKTGKVENPEARNFIKVKKGYTFFKENDVLFAKITPCMENGKMAIAKGLKNGFGFGSTEFHVLRTPNQINEKFVHYLVRSKQFRLEAKAEMTGAVGQQRVPKDFLINYPFPLPPKEEQDEIVNILDGLLANEEESLNILQIETRLNQLKQSILSKAFKGQLGTNDPTEESAIELLKEVLQEKL